MSRAKPPPAPPNSPDEVEAQFYEALQRADLDTLMAVWSDDDDIVCVHPGGPRVVGASAIRAGFEAIFANGGVPVVPEQVRRLQTLTCAVHSVLERIEVGGEPGAQTAWVVATNVYVKTTQGWRLAAHHASPGTAREPADPVEASTTLH
ncbi:MAG: nuclear transport factor 2 family protein [Piscinibacter sp.]|uniref:YybH family protein n=1 Tax=Piscinibacter TaxID=1114981 RepID=UPI000FDCF281|nr:MULTISPECIES: SgcJ/EcaC family oxidoreductase [Piscinibacter]MCW5664792.1 nuclear transport factor 2 family protein [Piscinibacter sp.]